MSYILITKSDGVSFSLAHSDDEGTYLANHGVKNQRLGIRRFQNPDGSLAEKVKRRIKTLNGKSDKLDAKKAKLNLPKNKASYALTNNASKVATKKDYKTKKAAEYDNYITKHQNKEAEIDRKKIKVESKLNPLKEIDAEYARSLAEKVDKRKDKK